MQTYPGVKVLWSDVRFKWSKSRSQYLQWSSVDWVLLVWIVVNLAKNLTMEINQVALWTEGERERERTLNIVLLATRAIQKLTPV